MADSRSILGVDFGLTDCVAAVMSGSAPEVVRTSAAQASTPCYVALTKDGQWLAGLPAKRQAITNSANTVFYFRDLLGRHYDDIIATYAAFPYRLVRLSTGDIRIAVGNAEYPLDHIVAILLRTVRADAEAFARTLITHAVITVPTDATERTRNTIERAANQAGLVVIGFIDEPVAATLSYLKAHEPGMVFVYDMGKMVCNVSVLESLAYKVMVRVPPRDLPVGSDHLDAAVVEWLVDQFRSAHGIDLREDRMAMQRLSEAASRAREQLLDNESVDIDLPYIYYGPVHLFQSLSREEYERIVQPLIARTLHGVYRCLFDADLGERDITHILLAGDCAGIPVIRRSLNAIFRKDSHILPAPTQSKALGAAIYGALLTTEKHDKEESGQTRVRFMSDAEKLRYYGSVLGLKGEFQPLNIKRLYREAIGQYHPDRVQHLGKALRDLAESKSKEINEAYAWFKSHYPTE